MRWQGSGTFGICCRSRRRCSTKRRKSVLRPVAQSAHNATLIPAPMILGALHRIADCRESLSREEARAVTAEILSGKCTGAQIAALLVALHMKGETVEEIVGFAEAIRQAAAPFILGRNSTLDVSGTERDALVDTCGTGGDASGTFNISTATAFTVAGAGVRVAKHGNRSVTSRCGSADVIETLGVNIAMPAARLGHCLRQVGIAFLYAPAMHSAMKAVQAARQQLRMRTIFNLLGPLTNPAGASAQIVGVYAEAMVEKLAAALRELGVRRALVVHGKDGLDEITISEETRVAEVRDGKVRTYDIAPEQFGLRRSPLSEIAGGDAKKNAEIIRRILDGEKSPRRDVVLLNAGAALMAAGRAEDMREGIALAAKAVDSGGAKQKLAALVEFTNLS